MLASEIFREIARLAEESFTMVSDGPGVMKSTGFSMQTFIQKLQMKANELEKSQDMDVAMSDPDW